MNSNTPPLIPPEASLLIHSGHQHLLITEDGATTTWPASPLSPLLETLSHSEAAWWSSAATQPTNTPVRILALYEECAHWLQQALEATSISVQEAAAHTIVLTDDYLRPELASITTPCLLTKPVGHTIWIGPILQHDHGPCYQCLAHWLRLHRWKQAAFCGTGPEVHLPQPSIAALPSTLLLASGLIATAAAQWLSESSLPAIRGAILTFDTRSLRLHSHSIRSRPGCSCHNASQPLPLRSFASSVTGIVSNLQSTTTSIGGVFHSKATGLLPLPVANARPILEPIVASGKGQTIQEAEDCCIAEALERYSTFFRGDEPLHNSVPHGAAFHHPNDIQLFSASQFETRDAWNSLHGSAHYIPHPWDSASPTQWVQARSLSGNSPVYVPAALCYLGYPSSLAPFAAGDSTGCASHTTIEAAVQLGLLELIERDAASIWWYNQLRRPAIPIDAFASPRLLRARHEFTSIERTLHILDLTTDIPVPAYAAISTKLDNTDPRLAFAAHPNPEIAAWKAAAELAQLIFWKAATAPLLPDTPGFLLPHGAAEPRPAPAPEHWLPPGIHPCWVDLTRTDTGIPTARVFAPGLRPLRARFAPGRLSGAAFNPMPFPL